MDKHKDFVSYYIRTRSNAVNGTSELDCDYHITLEVTVTLSHLHNPKGS